MISSERRESSVKDSVVAVFGFIEERISLKQISERNKQTKKKLQKKKGTKLKKTRKKKRKRENIK